jgi:hypothetical protein
MLFYLPRSQRMEIVSIVQYSGNGSCVPGFLQ